MMNINLLPWRQYQRERQKRIKKICWGFVILCVAIIFTYVKFFKTTIILQPFPQKQPKKIMKPSIISLQTISIHQMKLVGFIQRNDLTWALIRLPNDTVKVIKTHDRIGKEQATVVQISEQEVVVRVLGKIFYIQSFI